MRSIGLGAERVSCPACGTAYFAGESACPKCGQVNPAIAAAGRAARRRLGWRRKLRLGVVLLLLCGVAAVVAWAWQSQPLPFVRRLQAALAARDAEAVSAWCDWTELADRCRAEAPDLAEHLGAGADLAAALHGLVREQVAAGRPLGGWQSGSVDVARVGLAYEIRGPSAPDDVLVLRHDWHGGWRIVGLPWRRLGQP